MVTQMTTDDAYRLLMEGQRALSHVEANGMRIDTAYVERMWEESAQLLEEKEAELKTGEIWDHWRKAYGSEANLDSGEQLGRVVFDIMGVPCTKRTPTGRPKTDEEALEKVKFPWVQKYVTRKKLFTAHNTFLAGIRRETVDGFLHPVFSLNKVISYRSSASLPNSQNFPSRIDRTARLVRQAFIPYDDNYEIVEFDLKGAEVCVSACYHKDPTMIDYIERGHDYHKELACQCYKLKPPEVTKLVRGEAKADFVFSSFYGSWWPNIAAKMWEAIETDSLKRVDGVGLHEHLAAAGITKLGDGGREPEPGTFQAHIAAVYDDFWNRRFKIYSNWKDEQWQEYLRKGFCQSYTGFIYQGIANKREVINYRIQGSSFHCLLWSLVEVNEWLIRNKMRSRIIGQIHDSILMDIHKAEFDDVVMYVTYVIRQKIREVWPWIIVRLDVEAARSAETWYHKKEFELPKVLSI